YRNLTSELPAKANLPANKRPYCPRRDAADPEPVTSFIMRGLRGRSFLPVNLATRAPMVHITPIEFRPDDLASRQARVGLTTFLPRSRRNRLALARGLTTHVHERTAI